MALTSVAVPTVERVSDPIRSWSTMMAVVSPSSTSTSGLANVGMNPCTKALYVSLINRCDSAAIVLTTRELFPDPDTPVNTVNRRFGISTHTSLRLFSRAPETRIRSCPPAARIGTTLPSRRGSTTNRLDRAGGLLVSSDRGVGTATHGVIIFSPFARSVCPR